MLPPKSHLRRNTSRGGRSTPAYAIATTGAAAARLLPELGTLPPGLSTLLTKETAYGVVFQELLPETGRTLVAGDRATDWRPPKVNYRWADQIDPDELENRRSSPAS